MKKKKEQKAAPKKRETAWRREGTLRRDGPPIGVVKAFRTFWHAYTVALNNRMTKWKAINVLDPKPSIRSIARQLGVSHGTILSIFSGLERDVGKPVIDPGTLELTPTGEQLLDWAEILLRTYDNGMYNLSRGLPWDSPVPVGEE